MKGYIHLHDDCNKECVTINVEYITSVYNNSYGNAVVRTVDGCKYYVCESRREVVQKIEDALKNSSCIDNVGYNSIECNESKEVVTCDICVNSKDLGVCNYFCTVYQCRVASSDHCGDGMRKDQSSK